MLRDYQIRSIDLIRKEFASGKRKCLLRLATGAGKTVIFSEILRQSSENGRNCLLVTRGREIVNQSSNRLRADGIKHGVRMAGHWAVDYSSKLQVASIDTLIARKDFPPADLIVIDEADQATSNGYKKFVEHYPNAYFVSVTATPYTQKSLRHIADIVVSPIKISALINQGYLAPLRYFAPSVPDLKGVRIQKGEYNNEQLEDRMKNLTGDIVDHWRKIGDGRPTLLFAVNLHHSRSLRDSFLLNGINAEHCDALSDDSERTASFDRLKSGQTKVLCTVGIATRGVDLPFVSCLIMARPTQSYALYIQMLGRGTRICDGKENCLVLDHAGNVLRHDFFHHEPDVDLDGMPIVKKEISAKTCEQCFAIYIGNTCHACNFTPPITSKENIIETDEGILEEIKDMPQAAQISIYIRRMQNVAKQHGYKKSWVYYQVVQAYGEDVAKIACPRRELPFWMRK